MVSDKLALFCIQEHSHTHTDKDTDYIYPWPRAVSASCPHAALCPSHSVTSTRLTAADTTQLCCPLCIILLFYVSISPWIFPSFSCEGRCITSRMLPHIWIPKWSKSGLVSLWGVNMLSVQDINTQWLILYFLGPIPNVPLSLWFCTVMSCEGVSHFSVRLRGRTTNRDLTWKKGAWEISYDTPCSLTRWQSKDKGRKRRIRKHINVSNEA